MSADQYHELLDRAAAQKEWREQAERDPRAARSAESARRAELARRERLAGLAAEGGDAWARVAARIAERKPSEYDVAMDLLMDLREVRDPAVFESRSEALCRGPARTPAAVCWTFTRHTHVPSLAVQTICG